MTPQEFDKRLADAMSALLKPSSAGGFIHTCDVRRVCDELRERATAAEPGEQVPHVCIGCGKPPYCSLVGNSCWRCRDAKCKEWIRGWQSFANWQARNAPPPDHIADASKNVAPLAPSPQEPRRYPSGTLFKHKTKMLSACVWARSDGPNVVYWQFAMQGVPGWKCPKVPANPTLKEIFGTDAANWTAVESEVG